MDFRILIKPVIKAFASLVSWMVYFYNRLRWKAPVLPNRYIWIRPDQIEKSIEFSKILKQRRYLLDGIIIAGEWGKSNYTINRLHSGLFKSFDKYFNESIPFEQTEYFKKKFNGFAKMKAKKYQRKYGKIYQDISKNGFKIPASIFDNVDEFRVSIGSKGDILFMTGKHRLAIAKTLGKDFKIPAKVSHRHTDWQIYRDRLFKKLSEGEITEEFIKELNHPDLFDLIE